MSDTVRTELNHPQGRFISLPHKFRAFVGGFGSGKTWVGCTSLAQHFMEHPRINAGYFAPTYPQIRDIFFPTIEEALHPWRLSCRIMESNKEVHLYCGGKYRGTIICRSMEQPYSIVGFKIGKALVDEIDVMPTDKAELAWRKIIARLRYQADDLANGIDVTTTPEGFKFVHRQFVTQPREKEALRPLYGLVQASTYANRHNLPEDYIPALLASYPEQHIAAYINGEFVNLQTGSVYASFNRELNRCRDTIQADEPLFVGMDFNVGKMAAIIHVKRDGLPRAVTEIVNAYDTPDMIRRLKERFWRHDGERYVPAHQIRVYPDASGDSRRSVNASSTDLALLREAGFVVCAPRDNPPVKDRVNAMNGMFCNAQGERRYRVNPDTCPTYVACLEQQAWNAAGEPDKSAGHDHATDAAGYFIHQEYPIISRTVIQRGFYQ